MNDFSEHPSLRSIKWLLAGLAFLFVVIWLAPPHRAFEDIAKYNSVHLPVETLSIVVSMLVFGVAWNAYSRDRAANSIILATGLLATGLLDFAHMMSFAGMPAWVTPADPEKAINFWLMARLVFAVTLLTVALRPWRPFAYPAARYHLLLAALGISALGYWVGLYHADWLPRSFIAGQGLTRFKIDAEYFIVILLAIAATLFWRQNTRPATPEATGLFAAAAITVLSELSFTLYSDVTDIFNLLGHFYKVLSYLFVYRTVFVGSVHEPFRRVLRAEAALRETSQRFQATFNQAAAGIAMVSPDGRTLRAVNQRLCAITGYSEAELLATSLNELIHPDDLDVDAEFTRQLLGNQISHYTVEKRYLRKDKSIVWINLTRSLVRDSAGLPDYFVSVVVDIQDRKTAEIALRHANRTLRTLSRCNHALVHATSEDELLRNMCRNIVETGGHLLSWIGYAEQDAARHVRIVASHALQPGYLDGLEITWDNAASGQGPTGTAIRTGQTQIAQHIASDPRMAPWRERALAYGYQASIALPLRKDDHIMGVLTIYASEADAFDSAEVELLEELANDISFGITSLHLRGERDTALSERQHALEKLGAVLEDTVQAIATTVEMRDPYTAGHQRRVADLAAAIGGELGLPHERIFAIHLAGMVHDLGKISIPAEILSKPGRLNDIAYALIKQHAQAGYDILKEVDFPWPLAQFVLQHHERLDGSGYPNGLTGDAILLEARIIAVADVIEAMSSHRPYRPGLGLETALAEVSKGRGTLYDADVVDAALRLFHERGYQIKH
jgi:PAS domain S-box-containing protein